MKTDKTLLLLAGLAAVVFSTGCAKLWVRNEAPVQRPIISDAAEPPPGVVRYCWEEPKVAYEPNGPGVDVDGKWYQPYYQAVREVKMGRWVPCVK
jgi:hypothetical protein